MAETDNDVSQNTIDSKISQETVASKDELISKYAGETSGSSGYGDSLLKLMRSNGIYRREDMNLYDNFYRFPRLDPFSVVTTTREYVFFVKPRLQLFSSQGVLMDHLSNNPFFKDLCARGYTRTLEQLQYGAGGWFPFMTLLSNRKTSNIDLPGIHADTQETNANNYGTKIYYRKSAEPSDENVEFSVEFEDTKYLEVYTLFRAYEEYEKRKWYGEIQIPHSFAEQKIVHDKMTVFKFTVGEDGETILHWAQWWGVMPTTVPRDAFSDMSQDGHLKFTVSFKADFVEDMSPITLKHFNALAKTIYCAKGSIPLWDSENKLVSGENVKKPYIENYTAHDNAKQTFKNTMKQYKLKWGGD